MSWEKVGEIGVDAGLCWIGDPCYCVTPDCSSHPAKTWDEFCDKLSKHKDEQRANGQQTGAMEWDHGTGVSVQTGYGDGCYPVFVQRDKHGRVMRAMVVFDDVEEGEDLED